MKVPYRPFVVLALGLALVLGFQANPPAARAAGSPNTSGVEGPRAVGVKVDPRMVPPLRAGSPGPVQERPRRYPVDPSAFGQMKAEANAAAQASDRLNGESSVGTPPPAPQFPTLDFGQSGGWNPPDGALAAGPNHLLVVVNESLAVYNRSGGAPVLGPLSLPAFFGTSDSTFDPRAFYDAASGRFVLLGVTYGGGTSRYALAVSATNNPTGSWTTYLINAVTGSGSSAAWADFPGLGMDGTNLYITSNQFAFSGSSFQFARLLVIPKASAYAGTVTSTDFQRLQNPGNTSLAFTVQPAHQPDALSGQTTPMYLVNALWSSGSSLAVRSVTSTSSGPVLNAATWVGVAPYNLPAGAPQAGANQRGAKRRLIDTGDTRLPAAVHRYGSIYASNTTRSVSNTLTSTPNAYANAQWYVFAPGAGTATSRAVTSSSVAYFFPGVMPGNGFVGLQVSGSGPNQAASAFSFRDTGSPVAYAQGVGNYTLNSRWGDYPGVSSDPSNGSAVWVLGEYAKSTSAWGTAVTSVGQ